MARDDAEEGQNDAKSGAYEDEHEQALEAELVLLSVLVHVAHAVTEATVTVCLGLSSGSDGRLGGCRGNGGSSNGHYWRHLRVRSVRKGWVVGHPGHVARNEGGVVGRRHSVSAATTTTRTGAVRRAWLLCGSGWGVMRPMTMMTVVVTVVTVMVAESPAASGPVRAETVRRSLVRALLIGAVGVLASAT